MPWDLSGPPTFVQSKDVSATIDTVTGAIALSADGTKLYVLNRNSGLSFPNQCVGQFTLATPFDISTASYASKFLQYRAEFGASVGGSGMAFKTDGTKVYVVGNSSPNGLDWVQPYALATAWDLSTASAGTGKQIFVSNFAMGAVRFKTDGTRMFVVNNGTGTTRTIRQYSLTAWDVTTLAFLSSFQVSDTTGATSSNSIGGLDFSSDGTVMFVHALTATSAFLYQFALGTAWDVTTASYSGTRFETPVGNSQLNTFFRQDTGTTYFGANLGVVYEFATEAAGGTTIGINVPSGSLALTAHAPTVAVSANQVIAVPAGALTLTAHAPTVFVASPRSIAVPRAALSLTAYPPLVSVSAGSDGGGGSGGSGANAGDSARARSGLLLTDDLPLLTTAQLGAFAEAQALPQRYGDLRKTRCNLLRMTATKYIFAGHAAEVTRAFTGDLETHAFAAYVRAIAGVIVTIVEFAAPVPLGTACSASGFGKRHAVTGALIENPADIAADLLALAGRDDPWFGQLRAEASAIPLAGSFSTRLALRDAIDIVMDSAGAIWCPGMARLYPTTFEGFRINLDATNTHDLQVTASATDTADILRMTFDFDEVEGRSQSFIQLEASPQRYGGQRVDIDFPFVRNAATAEAIGRRVLGWYAGERYDVAARVNLGEVDQGGEFVRPGTWALLEHAQWPFAETANLMLTQAVIRRRENFAEVSGEVLRSSPTIALTKHSLGTNSIGAGGIEVDVRNGVATFTVRDNDDKPLAGAYVSLDGEAPKKTNGQGQVVFTAQAGAHELAVEAAGFVPYTIEVTL